MEATPFTKASEYLCNNLFRSAGGWSAINGTQREYVVDVMRSAVSIANGLNLALPTGITQSMVDDYRWMLSHISADYSTIADGGCKHRDVIHRRRAIAKALCNMVPPHACRPITFELIAWLMSGHRHAGRISQLLGKMLTTQEQATVSIACNALEHRGWTRLKTTAQS